jgi:hypothetical protein
MQRSELEHVIRASGEIADDDEFIIIGSQAIRSHFHATHGYYAQGVGPETATLPKGWRDRLLPVKNENTNGITGLCLEVHDLAISKLVANRSKDTAFVSTLVYHEMISHCTMLQRLSETDLTDPERSRINLRIDSMFDS